MRMIVQKKEGIKLNQEFLYIISIIGLGYLCKRLNLIKEKDGETISRIIFNLSLPALIIVSLNSVKIESALIMIPIIVLLYGILSIIVAFFIFKKEEKELRGTLMMLAAGHNVGLFVFPIAESIWGAKGLLYFGMFDAGTSVIVFGLVYLVGSYYSEEGLSLRPVAILKKFGRSLPFMSYLTMSVLNFCHIHLPSGIIDVASIISKANMPLSLLLLGLYLNFSFEKKFLRPIIKILLFRYGIGLLIGISLYMLLPFNEMFRTTLLMGLILPVGLAVIPYAHEFKYKTTILIGTISNICIFVSIVLLYVFANIIL
jgi:predicted permease